MKLLCALFLVCLLAACSPARKTTLTSTGENRAKAELVEDVAQTKSSPAEDHRDRNLQMLGTWVLHTMQRQPSQTEETLNISLQLKSNKTFVAETACGEIKGNYRINDEGIRFRKATFTPENCGSQEQLDAVVSSLMHRVSRYSKNGNMLFLKDKEGNNVFRVVR